MSLSLLRGLFIASPVALLTSFGSVPSQAADPAEVAEAMERAARFYHGSVSRQGGYVYYTSPDFSRRLGEGVAGEQEIWVQPPGTPMVGEAFLKAYQSTKRPLYLQAAQDAAEALLHGQLQSGAWTNSIDFDPKGPRTARYREGRGNPRGRNFSTLDDNISQAALQFLMRLDQVLEFSDREIHEGVTYALDALLEAQFPNGAFPQGWDETLVQPEASSQVKGNYPEYDWRTEGRIKEYWDQYNLNDDIAPTVVATLILAHQVYERGDCLEALKRLGDFLIRSQMPAPQSGWAQQYNQDLMPIWARAFEPPAVSGRETEGVVAALLETAVYTRDAKYLGPIPDALRYLEESELPGRMLARYYELETNRPLYMEREGKVYRLSYDDARLPSHYGWKTPSRVDELRKAYQDVLARKPLPDPVLPESERAPTVSEVLESLDEEGRWISIFAGERLVGQPKFQEGEPYLDSAIFARNLTILADSLTP